MTGIVLAFAVGIDSLVGRSRASHGPRPIDTTTPTHPSLVEPGVLRTGSTARKGAPHVQPCCRDA